MLPSHEISATKALPKDWQRIGGICEGQGPSSKGFPGFKNPLISLDPGVFKAACTLIR